MTEACNNVVLHAYGGGEGAMEVEIHAGPPALRAVVRDYGDGIRPRVQSAEQTVGGIGLPVIRALARKAEFVDLDPGPGTEVRLEFATSKPLALEEPATESRFEFPASADWQLTDTMAMELAPSELARSVLPRVLAGLAARAHFPTDRISDTQLLADTLVQRTDGSLGASHLSVLVGVAPRMLELQVGPLGSGRASTLLDDAADERDGLGGMLERLTDSYRVTPAGASSEVLALQLGARR
jgi:hypothetical protein